MAAAGIARAAGVGTAAAAGIAEFEQVAGTVAAVGTVVAAVVGIAAAAGTAEFERVAGTVAAAGIAQVARVADTAAPVVLGAHRSPGRKPGKSSPRLVHRSHTLNKKPYYCPSLSLYSMYKKSIK